MRPAAVLIAFLLAGAGATAGYFQYDHGRAVRETARALTAGDPERGKGKVQEYGCAACHDVPGIRGTSANVGPSLAHIAGRMYIAGAAQNTPGNLVHFIQQPRDVIANGAMPNLHVGEADARDIAAFLYTLE